MNRIRLIGVALIGAGVAMAGIYCVLTVSRENSTTNNTAGSRNKLQLPSIDTLAETIKAAPEDMSNISQETSAPKETSIVAPTSTTAPYQMTSPAHRSPSDPAGATTTTPKLQKGAVEYISVT